VLAITDQVKDRQSRLADHDGFTVDQTRLDREIIDGVGDQRKTIGEVITVAREQPDAARVAPRQNAKSVVLDLANPIGPGRRLFGRTG